MRRPMLVLMLAALGGCRPQMPAGGGPWPSGADASIAAPGAGCIGSADGGADAEVSALSLQAVQCEVGLRGDAYCQSFAQQFVRSGTATAHCLTDIVFVGGPPGMFDYFPQGHCLWVDTCEGYDSHGVPWDCRCGTTGNGVYGCVGLTLCVRQDAGASSCEPACM